MLHIGLTKYYPGITAKYSAYVTQWELCEICGICAKTACHLELQGEIPYTIEQNHLIRTHGIKLTDILAHLYRCECKQEADGPYIRAMRIFNDERPYIKIKKCNLDIIDILFSNVTYKSYWINKSKVRVIRSKQFVYWIFCVVFHFTGIKPIFTNNKEQCKPAHYQQKHIPFYKEKALIRVLKKLIHTSTLSIVRRA